MITLPARCIGKGYRQLQLDEEIKTTDQWYSIMHEMNRENPWRDSQYWTSDNKKHDGKVPYRRPVALKARIVSRFLVIRKFLKWANQPVCIYTEDAAGIGPDYVKRWKTWF